MDFLMIIKKQLNSNLSLPTHDQLEVLFSQLSYLTNLRGLIFRSSIKDVINNRENLQKYLLATANLDDSI